MKKLVVLSICALLLQACNGRKEYAYNEKTADLFLKMMNVVDERFEELQNGAFDGNNADRFDYEARFKKAQRIAKYSAEMKVLLEELKPSEEAQDFHKQVGEYMLVVKDQYGPLFVRYVEARDSLEKNRIREENNLKNMLLTAQADKTLQVQKEYFNRVGLQATEE